MQPSTSVLRIVCKPISSRNSEPADAHEHNANFVPVTDSDDLFVEEDIVDDGGGNQVNYLTESIRVLERKRASNSSSFSGLHFLLVISFIPYDRWGGALLYLQSVATLLTSYENSKVDVIIGVPQRQTLMDDNFVVPVHPGSSVEIIGPRHRLTMDLVPRRATERLLPKKAMEYTLKVLKEREYDAIIARGAVTKLIAQNSELVGRTIFIEEDSSNDAPRDIVLAQGGVVAPMSPAVFSDLAVRLSHQLSFIPPMISRPSVLEPRSTRKGRTLCYLGSFVKGKYLTDEILDGFAAVHKEFPDSKFIVAGGIFSGFSFAEREALIARFQTESGVEYKNMLSPQECEDIYLNVCDFGVRGYSLDRNVLGTKVLQMSSHALPIITNPQQIHRLMFGDDYSLFFNRENNVSTSFAMALRRGFISTDDDYAKWSSIVFFAAQSFQMNSIRPFVSKALQELRNHEKHHFYETHFRSRRIISQKVTSQKKVVLSIVGARHQFIKAGVVSRELEKVNVEGVLIYTGRNEDWKTDGQFEELQLKEPSTSIGVDVGSGKAGERLSRLVEKLEAVVENTAGLCAVLVYGDTDSTLAGALVAAKRRVPVIHVEAGIRSLDMFQPEEINRIVTDRVSSLMLCTSLSFVDNLRAEGITDGVFNVGDVMHDVLLQSVHMAREKKKLESIVPYKHGSYILMVIRRADNVDDPVHLQAIIDGVIPSGKQILWPIHPRSRKVLQDVKVPDCVHLVEPLSFLEMLVVMDGCWKVITDSSEMQKEAYYMRKQCVTVRDDTEWVETLRGNWNVLVGVDRKAIVEALQAIPSFLQYPYYGTGKAARKIAAHIACFVLENESVCEYARAVQQSD